MIKFHIEEKDLISACLVDRKIFVDFYDHIKPEYFKDKNISNIFKVIRVYFNHYKDMPPANAVKSLLRKKQLFEASDEVDSIFNKNDFKSKELLFLRDELKKFIKTEKLKEGIMTASETVDKIEDLENNLEFEEAERLVDDIEEVMKEAIRWSADVELGSKITDVEKRYNDIERATQNCIESPWDSLNKVIGGGWFTKELYYFIANSSVGKSIALDQCGLDAWLNGKNVVMITLEMSELKKAQRIDACFTQMPIFNVIKNRKMVSDAYNQLGEKENFFYIKEFPTSSISTNGIYQYLHQLEIYEGIHAEDIDLLIVDYADLMLPSRKVFGGEYEGHGVVAEDLRALAQNYKIPVLSCTQFSRGAISLNIEEISEMNIGDSIKKMRTVDCLIALHNSPEERQSGIIWMKAIKNRNGEKDWMGEFGVSYSTLSISG